MQANGLTAADGGVGNHHFVPQIGKLLPDLGAKARAAARPKSRGRKRSFLRPGKAEKHF